MGYSIFTISKNKHLQKKMFSFLSENMKSFNQHFHGSEEAYFGLRVGAKGQNGISYTGGMNNRDMIGFDFNCSGGERLHMFNLLKWIAKSISKDPNIYYYDGERSKFGGTIQEDFDHEAGVMYEHNNPKDKTLEDYKRMVSSFGFNVHPLKYEKTGLPSPNDWKEVGPKTNEEIVSEIKGYIDFIENDIKRLDELWTKSLKDESVSI